MERCPSRTKYSHVLWRNKPDGRDIREDYRVHSQEHSFLTNYDPEGAGGKFDLLP